MTDNCTFTSTRPRHGRVNNSMKRSKFTNLNVMEVRAQLAASAKSRSTNTQHNRGNNITVVPVHRWRVSSAIPSRSPSPIPTGQQESPEIDDVLGSILDMSIDTDGLEPQGFVSDQNPNPKSYLGGLKTVLGSIDRNDRLPVLAKQRHSSKMKGATVGSSHLSRSENF